MAIYAKEAEIYLAPTADARDTWQATLRHIAYEGRCFVLGCNQSVTRAMYPPDLDGIQELAGQPEVICRGGSAIISPLGEVLAGPLYDHEGSCLPIWIWPRWPEANSTSMWWATTHDPMSFS